MVAHNNPDILMLPYEDLPDEDKDVISKAIEEFQNKCLVSYTKTHDNKVRSQMGRPFRTNVHIQSGMIWSLFLLITGSQSLPGLLVKIVQAR